MHVEAGNSVKNVGDDESDEDVDDVIEMSIHSSEEESNEDNMDSSEESEKESETEAEQSVDYIALIEGDYLDVKLVDQLTKKPKMYCSQVTSVSETSTATSKVIVVTFLKQYRSHKDTFAWPEIEETSVVYPHEVIAKLPQPVELRYGRLQFPKPVF